MLKIFKDIKLRIGNLFHQQRKKADYFNTDSAVRCLCLYGPSGVGKSTTAKNLLYDGHFTPIEKTIILDGDVVRYYLNTDLDYSEKDRESNNIRIAKMAFMLMLQGFHIIIATQRADIAFDHLISLKKKYNKNRFTIEKELLKYEKNYS